MESFGFPSDGSAASSLDMLAEVKFSERRRRGRSLTVGSNLTGAYLEGVKLTKTNLTGADLSLVKGLDAVTLCKTIMPDGVVNNSDC